MTFKDDIAWSEQAQTRAGILEKTRNRMGEYFTANQVLGRTQTIGCTAVEITQRCNLDCTLCYLSENSESVRDIPVEEIYLRLDEIKKHYGEGAHVQITGGDPTLRKHGELLEIVRYARQVGLYPALFTNGIAASRKLLMQLAAAGLTDIAFHVDTSQKRDGFRTELELNRVRKEYMDRARGLGLMVIFNTTVHQGNFHEIPALVKFFIENADAVSFVSFQLQAETGRGEWGKRDALIKPATVRAQINEGGKKVLPWDRIRIGHPECHSYAQTMVINGNLYPVLDDQSLQDAFLRDFADILEDRHSPLNRIIYAYGLATLRRPGLWLPVIRYITGRIWNTRSDLVASRFKIHKLSFFIQNFMDADDLDKDRVDACSFMVMTSEGPVSMCAHNASRDEYILKPITIKHRDGSITNFIPLKKEPLDVNAA